MSRILLVEDEPRITSFLEKGLRAEGHATIAVATGEDAVPLVLSGEVDLVVLDLGLPGIDGYEVLRRVRAAGRSEPVIILTARDTVEDTVAGLDLGADDYLTKPFRFEELLARVRARLRERPEADETVLSTDTLSLDLRTRRATVDGRQLDLTAREYALLEAFLRHPGQVLSREQLLSHVWGYAFDPNSNVVDVYVRYLRRKLGAGTIQTVRGMGYRLTT